MKLKIICVTMMLMFGAAQWAWACNETTYAGCSPEELRAIQQQQFYNRKRQPVDIDDYWRDRQYADRLRQEDRNHELEIEKIRSETAIEVARQERRSWRLGGYYFHRPSAIVRPLPTHPIVVPPRPKPQPYGQDTTTSKPAYRRVPRATR